MGTINPYASPQAVDEVVPTAFPDGEGYYRDGKLLVVKNGAELPDRCVYCNEPSAPFRKTCNTLWISMLFGFARRVNVSYGVCSRHRFRQRMRWIFAIPLAFLLIISLGLRSTAPNTHQDFGAVFILFMAVYLLPVSLINSYWACPPLRVRKADHSKVWLRSAGKPFLASLGEGEK